MLIGFPGESEEVYEKYRADIPNLTHLPPPVGVFLVRFDRYSPCYMNAGEYGLDLSPHDFYHYLDPFPEEALRDIAYYFEDRNYNARHRAALVAWHTELDAAVGRWKGSGRWPTEPPSPSSALSRAGPPPWSATAGRENRWSIGRLLAAQREAGAAADASS